MDEYCGIDEILFMEEGMELMKKCSCKWGWMKCFLELMKCLSSIMDE
jgi:hypothetical protein